MAFDKFDVAALRPQLQDRLDRFLWVQDFDSLPLWRRFLVRSAQILYGIARDMSEGQLSLRAMSLVYSTVLGFIPTLALIFAVLKSLGVHNAMEPALNTLLEALGDRRDEVVAQIIEFVDNIQVGVIGITSMGVLVCLVLEMMRKIESCFNYIWNVSQGRSLSSRISEYLFAVIVSPLLIFLSISITSSLNTAFVTGYLDRLAFGGAIISVFAFVFPLLLMSLAFAFAYSFLPNTRVRFSSALIGGLVTTVSWKLMGAIFSQFLIGAARESIYLAFASVLVVMIFAYVGWLVALLGADIAYYHQYPRKTRTGRQPTPMSINQQEQLTLAVAAMVIRRFEKRQPPLDEVAIAGQLGIGQLTVERILRHLVDTGLLARTADDPPAYLPAHSVESCTLLEVWRSLRGAQNRDLQENRELAELQLVRKFLHNMNQVVAERLGDQKFTDSL